MTEDIFTLAISREKLSFTNGIWNSMKLNHPWIVGTVTAIIQQRTFQNKDEWKAYYFETGEKRQLALKTIDKEDAKHLSSIEVWQYNSLSNRSLQEINTLNGRTEEELDSLGDVLYGAVRATDNPHHITRHDCRYMVKYRLIGETWNGLIKREKNTMITMRNVLGSDFTLEKVDGEVDIRYEVDVEVHHAGKLLAGVQIKPDSYKRNFAGKAKFDKINKAKNDAYTNDYQVPVLYVYSNMQGRISNPEVFMDIEALLEKEQRHYVEYKD